MNRKPFLIVGLIWALVLISCTRSAQGAQPWRAASKRATDEAVKAATLAPQDNPKRAPGDPILTPTPDAPRVLPTPRTESDQYVVQPSDTLGQIAQRYGVSLESLIENNNLTDPDHLEVGQMLEIPAADPLPPGPGFKIVPDTELVYGPSSAGFDLNGFIHAIFLRAGSK